MVKLTPELIEQAYQVTNPVRDRELNLRGFKIPVIENLGATLDQFDTLDLSDNEIRKLDGFPLLKRLKCLLLNNNRITRIGENLEANLPNLESVILTNNTIQELGDLDNLLSVTSLTTLSLMRNPVTTKKFYRLYVINKLPQVRLLDFQKVRLKEREAAAKMFKGKKGRQFAAEIGKRAKTFVPGAPVGAPAKPAGAAAGPDASAAQATAAAEARARQHDMTAIREAISKATTLEEVERLNQLLKAGQIPGNAPPQQTNGNAQVEEEEEEMDV